jgi:hypothetical protein
MSVESKDKTLNQNISSNKVKGTRFDKEETSDRKENLTQNCADSFFF